MWSEVVETAIDVFAPNPGPDLDSIFHKGDPSLLRVCHSEPGAYKRRLNQSGWFEEEILAAGVLTQGKAQSFLSLATGLALVELARARRSKSLPREFCVAVTANRVIALAMSPVSEGGDGDDLIVKVKREERGSWTRGSVRIERDGRGAKSLMKGATFDIAGQERFAVNWGGDDSTNELVELLARG